MGRPRSGSGGSGAPPGGNAVRRPGGDAGAAELAQHWEADPERLEAVEQRLASLKRLEAKYRRSVDDLIVYRVGLDEQETRLQKDEDDLGGIRDQLAAEYATLKAAAAELSKQRKKIAKRLAAETQKQLAELGMAEARLEAVLEPIPLGDDPTGSEVPAWGAERLELTLAANPGEPALPLRKVASGGELSRSMLALKTVLAGHDRIGTLVFDEIDANVGGRLGDVIGQKLAALGRTHQVVCVTHLPQVASYARWHWTIRKTRRGGRTLTQIQGLEDAERLEELASMMRGACAAKPHARRRPPCWKQRAAAGEGPRRARRTAMPKLTVEDVGTFDVPQGKRLVLALEDEAKIDQLHACGGNARCTTCRVQFTVGEPDRMTEAEKQVLAARALTGVRLSCQIACDHDMTVPPISRLAGSGRKDAGTRPADAIQPPPVWAPK